MKSKKIFGIIGSILLLSSILGFAFASDLIPINTNVSVIYGGNAATSDVIGAISISDNINSGLETEAEASFNESSGVTETEIPLGGSIVVGDIKAILTDNQVPSLIDGKLSWDSENSSKTSFDVHEEIEIGDMKLQTSLDNNDFNQTALTNNKGLSYKYVFEENIGWDERDEENADDLKIKILGKEYQITDMTDSSISILNSDTKVLKEGDSIVVDGVTLTITNIFNDYVEINDVLIEEGNIKNVDKIRIEADTIAYSETETLSKVILNIAKGKDKNLELTFDDGDEYIEDDETWIWDISEPGKENGYICVHYDLDSIDPDEGVVYVGQSYVLPENYAELKFVKTTEADYTKFNLYFDEEDLYDSDPTNETINKIRLHDDADVVVIKGEDENSITLQWEGREVETDSIYFYHNVNKTEVYFNDINEEVDGAGRIRLAAIYPDLTNQTMATLVNDDTEIKVNLNNFTLNLDKIGVSLSKDFTHLGETDEDAEASEIKVDGTSIGTEENTVMDHYGNIIKNPENNANNDKVVLEVPNEQVYATVSILGGEVEYSTPEKIDFTVSTSLLTGTDTNKNLIVVGGSCINEIAAELLKGTATDPICGEDFTTLTGVSAGQYMIQVFNHPTETGKKAILIAGYNAEDTTRGVNDFLTQNLDLSVGKKYIK